MKTLYFEPGSGGHRAAFLNAIMLYGGDDWVVACPTALLAQLSSSARARLEPEGPIPLIETDTVYATDRASVRAQWKLSQELAKQQKCGEVFHPLIDLFVNNGPLLPYGAARVSGIYFRPMVHHKGLSTWEKAGAGLKALLSDHFLSRRDAGSLFTLDRYFPDWVQSHWRHGHKVRYLPDMVPVSQRVINEAQAAANPQLDRMPFVLFGALQRRKGIFETVEAIALLPEALSARADFRFLGQLDSDAFDLPARITALSKRSSVSIELHDIYLSQEELALEVASADVVLAPYQRHPGSSGVVYWAAAFGKPLITQNFGLIGREVHDFSLGQTVPDRDPRALAREIGRALEAKGIRFDPCGQRRYISGHRAEDFAATIVNELRTLVSANKGRT